MMAVSDELHFASARKLHSMLLAREISSIELVRAAYDRIGRINPRLNIGVLWRGTPGIGRKMKN